MKIHGPFWLATAATLALVPLFAAAQEKARATSHKLVPASEMKWTPLPGIPGAEQVALMGDQAKEPHRAMFKYPVGLKAPLHSHTHGDRAVVVSGALSITVEGEPAKRLPAGSYFSIAGGKKHLTEVLGDEPCVFYVERDGPFDVVAADAAPKR